MCFQRECPAKPIDGKKGQGIAHRQSDYCIVSKKLRNGSGEKAVAALKGTQGIHLPDAEPGNR